MSKTDYLELEVLRWCTGQVNALGTAITPWLALFTANPTDAGGGTELAAGGYARHNSTGKWAVPAAGSVSNNAQCSFGNASAAIGPITGFALFDASTGGNMVRWAALTVPKSVPLGDPYYFDPGQLTFTED